MTLLKVEQMPNPRTKGEMKSKKNRVIMLLEFLTTICELAGA